MRLGRSMAEREASESENERERKRHALVRDASVTYDQSHSLSLVNKG